MVRHVIDARDEGENNVHSPFPPRLSKRLHAFVFALLTTRELARRPAETAERRRAAGATPRLETRRALGEAEARMQTGAAVIIAAIFYVRE